MLRCDDGHRTTNSSVTIVIITGNTVVTLFIASTTSACIVSTLPLHKGHKIIKRNTAPLYISLTVTSITYYQIYVYAFIAAIIITIIVKGICTLHATCIIALYTQFKGMLLLPYKGHYPPA